MILNEIKESDGSITVQVAALLLFLTALALGAAVILRSSVMIESRAGDALDSQEQVNNELNKVLVLLSLDETPEGDSPHDHFFHQYKGPAIVTDASSFINLNLIRRQFIERTSLNSHLINGNNGLSFMDHREEYGLSLDLKEHYKEFFPPDFIDKSFSPYSYININTTHIEVLNDLYEQQGGNSPLIWEQKIQNLLINKIPLEQEGLDDFLGTDKKILSPLIGVLPNMNINFVSKEVLGYVLEYPYGDQAIPNHQQLVNHFLTLRDEQELTSEDIKQMIPINQTQNPQRGRIFHHLGALTWFWRITIPTTENENQVFIAGRLSDNEDTPFQIVDSWTEPVE